MLTNPVPCTAFHWQSDTQGRLTISMSKWLESFQPTTALLLRLALGFALAYWGWSKVIPAHGAGALSALNHHAAFVHSLGMPYWLGYVSAITEFLGGICLLLGLLTRFWAILGAVNMIFAICLVTLHHGYQASQYPLALTVMALMIASFGPGALALDRRIGLD